MECYGGSCCGNQTADDDVIAFDPPVPLEVAPVIKGAYAVNPTGDAGGGAPSKPPGSTLSLAQRDAALRKLGLPPNGELQEGLALTPEESTAFGEIKAKLPNAAACLNEYDETAQHRILRGMFTNNKGTRDQRIAETVSTFERVFKWKQENGLNESSYFASSSAVAPSVFRHWPTVIGGEDHYGHLVWTETLGDVSALVDAGVKEQQVLDVRAQICEAVERLKAESAARLGQRRYKQVCVCVCVCVRVCVCVCCARALDKSLSLGEDQAEPPPPSRRSTCSTSRRRTSRRSSVAATCSR